MTTTRLEIGTSVYVLARNDGGTWRELARLAGGAATLLPARANSALSDGDIEAAIERAEDWLMPHAKALAGTILEVQDATGGLVPSLAQTGSRDPAEVEEAFNRVIDSPRQRGDALFVAHLLLVRELTHHGRVAAVQFSMGAASDGAADVRRDP